MGSSPPPWDEKALPQSRGLSAIDGAIALIVILLIVQMWWLTASLEAYLSGHHESALPAAIVSGVLFIICLLLFLFIRRVDREVRGRAMARPETRGRS
jgi:predicted Co/Zn/Cd cation transporter (cation efflux family)